MAAEDIAKRVGLTPRQLRYWRRKGYVPAAQRVGKAWVYDLPTFKLLRLIADLLREGASPQSVVRAIKALEVDAERLLHRPLPALSVYVVGSEILVSDGKMLYSPATRNLVHPILVEEVFSKAERAARGAYLVPEATG
jgi:DNA-binding transcriptional MerR regulator